MSEWREGLGVRRVKGKAGEGEDYKGIIFSGVISNKKKSGKGVDVWLGALISERGHIKIL